MKFFTCFILMTAIFLQSCGTLNTVPKTDKQIASNLKQQRTRCTEIPRVYSGVSHDFCVFHAEPKAISFYFDAEMYFWLADMCFSGVADTIVLPYTIYQQSNSGTIGLN